MIEHDAVGGRGLQIFQCYGSRLGKTICYEYNFCSLKERNEVQHISMGYHALAWLTEDTSIHALKRQMTRGDVCEAPPAHKTPVTTVISQFLRSSPR